jgi:hypothetical protein
MEQNKSPSYDIVELDAYQTRAALDLGNCGHLVSTSRFQWNIILLFSHFGSRQSCCLGVSQDILHNLKGGDYWEWQLSEEAILTHCHFLIRSRCTRKPSALYLNRFFLSSHAQQKHPVKFIGIRIPQKYQP